MELSPEEKHDDRKEAGRSGEFGAPLSAMLSDLMATLDELPAPDAPVDPEAIPDPVRMDVDPNSPEANPAKPAVPDEFLDDLISDPALDAAPESGQPASAGLDAVVAEIDRQSEAVFGSRGDFAFRDDRPAKGTLKGETCIVFSLDGTAYAIPVRNVIEMDTFPRTTPVPNVPGFVRGVTNVRGEIIPVLDLRSLFGMERWEFAERGRILIVRTADQHTAALAVDAVQGTASMSLADLGAPAGPIHDKVAGVLLGAGEHEDRVLNVLDVDKMFRMPEIRRLTES